MPKPLSSDYAFRRQNLLIELYAFPPSFHIFTYLTPGYRSASLKYAAPQGVYMSLSPQEPSLWWGVMFVRKGSPLPPKHRSSAASDIMLFPGPYTSAVLKFTVLFPTGYPAHPPIITFLSDIYHPLIVPPTPPPQSTNPAASTNSSPGKSQQQHTSAAHINYNQNVSNLPPGSFSLKHGFPSWHSTHSPKTSLSPGSKKLPPNPPITSLDPIAASTSYLPPPAEKEKSILQVLYYLKSVFSSVSVLDDIPPQLAVNLGACRAWRDFREASKIGGKEEGKRAWLEKVSGCVAGSQTEGVLYGGMGVGRGGGGLGNEEMVRDKFYNFFNRTNDFP